VAIWLSDSLAVSFRLRFHASIASATGIRTAGPSDRMAWMGWPWITGCFG